MAELIKFQTRRHFIHAQQFLPPDQIPTMVEIRDLHSCGRKDEKGRDLYAAYIGDSSDGSWRHLQTGYWVYRHENGEIDVMDEADLETIYERIF